MNRILVVAVLMILFVLCISTTAWSEPVLFLLVMGVAILLNRGTNIFIGTISFMTNNVAIILQLATSMGLLDFPFGRVFPGAGTGRFR